jgi:GNAT superfamily N-acetyltransferase
VLVEEVAIRPATVDDMEAMVGLLRLLFAIEADFDFDAGKQARGLDMLLSRGRDAHILVAQHRGQVIGMCTLQCLVSTAEGGEVGLIEDMVVAEAWRGRGIGRGLLDAMQEWAGARGLGRLQLLADRDNRSAFGFYAALGWSETRLLALRKHLPRP